MYLTAIHFHTKSTAKVIQLLGTSGKKEQSTGRQIQMGMTNPWKCSRRGWQGLWAIWSSARCPCHFSNSLHSFSTMCAYFMLIQSWLKWVTGCWPTKSKLSRDGKWPGTTGNGIFFLPYEVTKIFYQNIEKPSSNQWVHLFPWHLTKLSHK